MIICEMCTNWTDLDIAKEMIQSAKENGAGLAKFQLFDSENDKGKPHYQWVKAHELTFDQAKELFDYGASIGQEVFFSVFGVKYVEWCEKIGVKRYKIASCLSNREKLYKRIGHFVPIIASTIINPPLTNSDYHISWLWCPPGYPRTHPDLGKIWKSFAGFSDHTIGVDAAKIALARGVKIIEKHFVLEHNPQYPDDAWSMDVNDLKELVRWEKVCQEVL